MSRLIDADRLKNHYAWWGDTTSDTGVCIKELFDTIIDRQPTADVRENVRGEWIDKGKDMTIRWQCSECGRRDTHIYNFCPDCGADMRDEQDK